MSTDNPEAHGAMDAGDSDPGEALLGAFLDSETASEAESDALERADETDDEPEAQEAQGETEEADAESEEDEVEASDEDAGDEAENEPEGDYVDLGDGNKVALAELLEAHQFRQQTENQFESIRNDAIARYNQQLEQHQSTLSERTKALEDAYELVSTLIPDRIASPDPSLLRTNPEEFYRLESIAREANARIDEARQQVEKARQERGETQTQQQQKRVNDAVSYMRSKYPDQWGDPQKAQKSAGELVSFLKGAYQFDDATIAAAVDHRFFEMAMDAQKFRASKAKGAPKPKEEKKAAPRLVRSSAKPAKATGKARSNAKAREALKRTGKVTDREAIFGDFV